MLQTGIYPNVLKIACINPIFKKGDMNDINNYKLISSLPLLNLILEKLCARFVNFLNKCK